MKKLVLMFAAALLAVLASAQTVSESKSSDNFYLGVNGGVITATHVARDKDVDDALCQYGVKS